MTYIAFIYYLCQPLKELWREHYGQIDLEKAVEFACKRWIYREQYDQDGYDCALAELIDKVSDTLRRPKARNFGV